MGWMAWRSVRRSPLGGSMGGKRDGREKGHQNQESKAKKGQLPLIPVPLTQAGLHLGWVSLHWVPYACLLVGSRLWFLSPEFLPPLGDTNHLSPRMPPSPPCAPNSWGWEIGTLLHLPHPISSSLPDARAPSLFQHRLSDSQLQLITLSVAGPES